MYDRIRQKSQKVFIGLIGGNELESELGAACCAGVVGGYYLLEVWLLDGGC